MIDIDRSLVGDIVADLVIAGHSRPFQVATLEECRSCVEGIDSSLESFSPGEGGDLRHWHFERCHVLAREMADNNVLREICEYFIGSHVSEVRCQAGVLKAGVANVSSGGGWHVDSRKRQFKAILCLTDVGYNNGPFAMLPQTSLRLSDFQTYQKAPGDTSRSRFHEQELHGHRDAWNQRLVNVGPTGTMFLVDTSNIHRGMPIVEGSRYSLTNYYYNLERD